MTTEGATPRNGFLKVLVPVVVILALAFAALSFLKSRVQGGAAPANAARVEVGAQLPDFTLKPLGKEPIRLSALHHKVMLLNFWASWCEACMTEMPSLVKLREAYGQRGLEVLGVNVDDEPETVIPKIVEEMKIRFPIFTDAEQRLSTLFDVHAIPLTVIMDADRKILFLEAGERDWNSPEIREKLDQWLSTG